MTNETAQVFAMLLNGATTETRIPWDWLKRSRNERMLMTEGERVEMFLRAMNGESLKVREWERFCGAPLEIPTISFKGDRAMWEELPIPFFDGARLPLKQALEAVIRSPDDVSQDIERNVTAITRGKVLIAAEEFESGAARDRVIAHDVGVGMAYTMRLVLDENRLFRKRLRQCEYTECGKLALGEPPSAKGRPRAFFCPGTDHGAQRKKELQNEWAAAHRDGKPVDEWRALKAAEAERKLRAQKARSKQQMRGTSK
jgi:hypothetical protein